jgi:internalin A
MRRSEELWHSTQANRIEKMDKQAQEQITSAVINLYQALEQWSPEVIFCPSPKAGLYHLLRCRVEKSQSLIELLLFQVVRRIRSEQWEFLHQVLQNNKIPPTEIAVDTEIDSFLRGEGIYLHGYYQYLSSTRIGEWVSILEYSAAEMGFELDSTQQIVLPCLRQLVEHGVGWIFPNRGICVVCDRPIKVLQDSSQRWHAEGEPVLQFADGWHTRYYYHGVRLPKTYARAHPHQWQAKWIAKESNAELRRVLIQAIGYGRLCQELDAKVVDTWREYTLLKIPIYDDFRAREPPRFRHQYV